MTGLLVLAADVKVDETPAGSPGFVGFVFTFLLAVALVLLFLSLTKHLRIVDRRAKQLGLDDDAEPDAPVGDAPAAAAASDDAPADDEAPGPNADGETAGPDRSR